MRARHDRTWWQTTVTTWRTSGLTAEQFAASHDVHPGTLRWWHRQFEVDAAEPSTALALLRVEVADERPAAPVSLAAVVGPAEVRFQVGTDARYVAAVVAAIAEAAGRC